MNSNKQIKIGAMVAYIAIAFNIIAGLLYTPWMIGKIGKSDFGLFTLVSSLIGMLTLDFGLGAAVVRFVSKYRAENNDEKVSHLLGIIYKIYGVLDVIIVLVATSIYFFIDDIYPELTAVELEKLKFIFILFIIFTALSFPFIPQNGLLQSYERFLFQKSMDLLRKILTIFLMVGALLFGFKLYALITVNVVVGLLIIVCKQLYINKMLPFKINWRIKDRAMVKQIAGYSTLTTVTLIAQRLILNITPSLLAFFSGTLEIAVFGVAMAIEGFVWTFANAVNGLFIPKLSRIIHGKNSDSESDTRVLELMLRVGRFQMVVMGLIIYGFVFSGHDFIILWLDESYLSAYYVVICLISPSIIVLTQQIANSTLTVKNKIGYQALATSITAVCSIALSLVLVKDYGAIGAGVAILIGNIIGRVVVLNVVYYKILRIDVFKFFKNCHLPMILPTLLIVAVGYAINLVDLKLTWLSFMLRNVTFALSYMSIVWLLFLRKEEKAVIPFIGKIGVGK